MLTSQQTPLPAFPDELELTALQKPFHSAWEIPAQSCQSSAQACNGGDLPLALGNNTSNCYDLQRIIVFNQHCERHATKQESSNA